MCSTCTLTCPVLSVPMKQSTLMERPPEFTGTELQSKLSSTRTAFLSWGPSLNSLRNVYRFFLFVCVGQTEDLAGRSRFTYALSLRDVRHMPFCRLFTLKRETWGGCAARLSSALTSAEIHFNLNICTLRTCRS